MSTITTGALYAVIEWAKTEGEVKALDRMRMFCLGALLSDNISGLEAVTKSTPCSTTTLDAVRTAAEKVVGKPYPR